MLTPPVTDTSTVPVAEVGRTEPLAASASPGPPRKLTTAGSTLSHEALASLEMVSICPTTKTDTTPSQASTSVSDAGQRPL